MTHPSDHPKQRPVGYGNPPTEHQFKPGQSGNPKGRPRQAKSRSAILRKVAFEKHWVNENGVQVRRSTLELAVLALRAIAMGGDIRATRFLSAWMDKFSTELPTDARGWVVVPAPARSIEEWEANVSMRTWRMAQGDKDHPSTKYIWRWANDHPGEE